MRRPKDLPVSLLVRVVSGVALAAVALWLFWPTAAPGAVAPATSARVTTTAGPTTTVRATIGAPTAVPTQAAARTPATFATSLSDADLTTAAASGFPQTVSGITVSDPKVTVETAGVRLTATAKVLFGTTQFVMTATPTVVDGRIVVRLDTATLAGFALPDSARVSITDTVQNTISKLIPANVRVTSVTFAPGRLTVLGTQP